MLAGGNGERGRKPKNGKRERRSTSSLSREMKTFVFQSDEVNPSTPATGKPFVAVEAGTRELFEDRGGFFLSGGESVRRWRDDQLCSRGVTFKVSVKCSLKIILTGVPHFPAFPRLLAALHAQPERGGRGDMDGPPASRKKAFGRNQRFLFPQEVP